MFNSLILNLKRLSAHLRSWVEPVSPYPKVTEMSLFLWRNSLSYSPLARVAVLTTLALLSRPGLLISVWWPESSSVISEGLQILSYIFLFSGNTLLCLPQWRRVIISWKPAKQSCDMQTKQFAATMLHSNVVIFILTWSLQGRKSLKDEIMEWYSFSSTCIKYLVKGRSPLEMCLQL